MIYFFGNTAFLNNMMSIIENHHISAIVDGSVPPKEKLQYEETLEGFGSQNFFYFYEAINKKMAKKGLEIATANFVFFYTNNSGKKHYFGIRKELDEFILYGETVSSIKNFLNNVVYSKEGLIRGFDELNKKSLDNLFIEGELSIINNFMSQQYGLDQLALQIEQESQEIINHYSETFSFLNPDAAKELKNAFDVHLGRNKYENYKISLYVMSVFSHIEHVAILVLPFWFALKDEKPFWRDFCNGFRSSAYDSFKDFWTSKDNWIGSFVETLCGFHRNNYKQPDGLFKSSSDKDKSLKRLYEQLRADYRNPIHHGLSTGKNRTGLSMEVPSLKKRVLFGMPPLLREIDNKTYTDSKRLLELFHSILKEKNPQIVSYLETELNVPIDCSELKPYILENNIEEFIFQYHDLQSHLDEIISMQAGE